MSIQKTARTTGGEWDPHSNKTVIVLGSDCWVVLGYSGLAYLDDKPTDQYIAECITEESDLSKVGAIFQWATTSLPHYREIRSRIASGLERAYANLPRTTRQTKTTVLASAIQIKGRQLIGRMFRIDMVSDSASCVELVPRDLLFTGYTLSAIGACEPGILNRLLDELTSHRIAMLTASPHEPRGSGRFRDLMIGAVQQTGALFPDTVGRHVLGVILDPNKNKVRIVYSSFDITGEPPVGKKIDESVANLPKVPTPWVLKPGGCFSPSAGTSGGWVDPRTGFTLEYSGFDTEGSSSWPIYFGKQPRKGRPL